MVRTLLLFVVLLLTTCREEISRAASGMERIGLSADRHGFVCLPSGRPFHPWGNNYGSKSRLIEDYWDSEWSVVEQDFREMKSMGANVVRVSLQFGKFMRSPTEPSSESLDRLSRLVRLAEETGLYLDLTGLACYRPTDVPPWYDTLSESDRWKAQERFWGAVAQRCADSPAILCYDLINEPVVATEKRKPGDWYTGKFGDMNFLQYLNLDPAGRSFKAIAGRWIDDMKKAIRRHDHRHFITAGWLPFDPGRSILERFDFVCVHIYPETGKLGQALKTLRRFNIGKPVVIEETFPLSCSAKDLKQFLLDSRRDACGWIGHYNGESEKELEALKASGKLTLPQAVFFAWLQLFRELGPVMAAAVDGSPAK